MRFVITALEKVRDVIEANDKESAIKLFHAKYPATIHITDIYEAARPDRKIIRDIIDSIQYETEIDESGIQEIIKDLKSTNIYKNQ